MAGGSGTYVLLLWGKIAKSRTKILTKITCCNWLAEIGMRGRDNSVSKATCQHKCELS